MRQVAISYYRPDGGHMYHNFFARWRDETLEEYLHTSMGGPDVAALQTRELASLGATLAVDHRKNILYLEFVSDEAYMEFMLRWS